MKIATARKQRGASLFVALVMMLAITMIGLAGANLSTSEERMARNARDSDIALQAAEAALRDAEADVSQTRALSGATLFSTSCDQSGGKGLCMPATTGTQQRWEAYLEDSARSLAYGELTRRRDFARRPNRAACRRSRATWSKRCPTPSAPACARAARAICTASRRWATARSPEPG